MACHPLSTPEPVPVAAGLNLYVENPEPVISVVTTFNFYQDSAELI